MATRCIYTNELSGTEVLKLYFSTISVTDTVLIYIYIFTEMKASV